MNEELKVIISAEVNKFKNSIKDAKAEIEGFKNKVKESAGDADKNIKKLGEGIGNAVKAGAKVAATAVASVGAAVTGLAKASIENYAEYEQLTGGVEKLFGNSADTIKKYASEAYKTAGVDANSYMNQITSFSASLIDSLGGDTARAAEIGDMAIKDMADNANTFGTDIESIQNAYQGFAKGNYQMLDNLKLGFGGTKEGMQDLLTKAEELTGKQFDISNFGDIVEAIHAVQDEMNITGTTANEAASTIQGSVDMTKAAWQNFLTSLSSGENVGESMQAVVDSAGKVFKNIIPVVKEVISNIPAAISEISPEAGAAVQTIFDTVEKMIPPIKDAISTVFDTLSSAIDFASQHVGLLTVIGAAIGVIVTAIGLYNAVSAVKIAMDAAQVTSLGALAAAWLAQAAAMMVALLPYILIVAAIAAVIAIIVLCVKHWDEIKEAVSNAWELIKQKTAEAATAVVNKFTEIKTKVSTAVENIKTAITEKFTSVKTKVTEIFTAIFNTIKEKITNAKNTVTSIVDKIKGAFNFKWSLPSLKIPHITVKGGEAPFGIGGKGSLPKFNIAWYARGGVFDSPTLFNSGNGLSGLGENGAEAVVPLENNTQWLDRIADMLSAKMGGTQPVILTVDGKVFGEITVDSINNLTRQRGSIPLKMY